MSLELEKLEALHERIGKIESLLLIGAKEDLTPEESALFLGCSIDHIYRLTSNVSGAPEIGFSKPGGKQKYILKSDLIDYMRKNRIDSAVEVVGKAKKYLKHKP